MFEGRCDELITPRTLGPFRDMARHHRRVFGVVLDDRDAFIDVLTGEMSFRQRPAVVIIEDLQWADHASLDIAGFLGRRVHALPALLVVSYRDDDVPDNEPLQRLLDPRSGHWRHGGHRRAARIDVASVLSWSRIPNPTAGEDALAGYLHEADFRFAGRPDLLIDGPCGLPPDLEDLREFHLPSSCLGDIRAS